MKQIVLFILSVFVMGLNAQNVVSGNKSFTFFKNEIKENQIKFELSNTLDQPFVTIDLSINSKINDDTKVYLQYDFQEYNGENALERIFVKKEWKADIHFDNTNSWNSTLEFLPINAKNLRVVFENAGNKIDKINLNFFYPGKTENLVKIKSTVEPTPTPAGTQDVCSCPIPDYESRADWDPTGTHPAQTSPSYTNVSHLVVHHAAGSNTSSDWAATVRGIWNYHVNSNGWSDIAYNYLIDPNGIIYEGRGNNIQGAHAAGFNSNSMGVCLLGNYQPDASQDVDPSLAMLNSLVAILSWKECDISQDPLLSSVHASTGQTKMNISGHRDVGTTVTTCPGQNVYNLLPNIRTSCSSYMTTCSFSADADLIVSALNTNPTTVNMGANTALNVAVGNGGSAAVNETLNVELKVDGNLIQTFAFDSINAGQILNFSYPNYQFTSLGNHQLCVYIDSASNETNTANNSYCKTIVVGDSVVIKSDLVVMNISSNLATAQVSETVTFSFDLKNVGAASTSEIVEGRIIIDGVTKQLFNIPILANAQNFLKTFAYSFNQSGDHNVCVEMNSPTNETNTANNSYCKTFEVKANSVGINDISANFENLNVFPNPAKDVLNIEFELIQKSKTSLNLINALGQKVWTKELGNNTKFQEKVNVNTFSEGIYFLQIKTDKAVYTQQVILK